MNAKTSATYRWTAIDPNSVDADGRLVFVRGTTRAPSEDSVRSQLASERGLTPISIDATKQSWGNREFSWSRVIGTPSVGALAEAYRQLATLVRSGLTLTQAVGHVSIGASDPLIKETFVQLGDQLLEGKSLADAMGMYPKIFGRVEVNLLRAAAEGGFVAETLDRVATMTEGRNVIKKKIRGAVMGPSFMVLAAIGAGVLMATKMIPQMVEVMSDIAPDAELPATTRAVMWGSDHILPIGLVAAAVAVGATLLHVRVLRHSDSWHVFKSKVALRTPVMSQLVKLQSLASLARGLEMMLKSGVQQSEALQALAPAMKNVLYRDSVMDMAKATIEGRQLSTVLKANPRLYKFTFSAAVAAGESSGRVDEMMGRIADQAEMDLKLFTDSLSELLTPLAMMVVGAIVGLLGAAYFGPMTALIGGI